VALDPAVKLLHQRESSRKTTTELAKDPDGYLGLSGSSSSARPLDLLSDFVSEFGQ
jgi:hypothetical protein